MNTRIIWLLPLNEPTQTEVGYFIDIDQSIVYRRVLLAVSSHHFRSVSNEFHHEFQSI